VGEFFVVAIPWIIEGAGEAYAAYRAYRTARATVATYRAYQAAKAAAKEATDKNCQKGCPPPCQTISGKIVPIGTKAYRPLDIIPDNIKQHGVFGSHHNIFIANQNPYNCKCFWKKEKYVLKPNQITPDMIPIEPFIY